MCEAQETAEFETHGGTPCERWKEGGTFFFRYNHTGVWRKDRAKGQIVQIEM